MASISFSLLSQCVILTELFCWLILSLHAWKTDIESSTQKTDVTFLRTSFSINHDGDGISGNVIKTDSPTKVITIKAQRFQYTPGIIRVKKGEHVKIIIDNTDTTHGIVIPDLGISGIDYVEFTADKSGTFEFRCPTPCGKGHLGMKGTLIVDE